MFLKGFNNSAFKKETLNFNEKRKLRSEKYKLKQKLFTVLNFAV